MAREIADDLPTKVCLSVSLKLTKDKDTPVNGQAIKAVKGLLKRYLQNDPDACILPWKDTDMSKIPAITKVKEIMAKISELWKQYTIGLRPRLDADCWFKLRVGGAADPQHFTSYDNSDTQDFVPRQ
jgi:hypothetical protein